MMSLGKERKLFLKLFWEKFALFIFVGVILLVSWFTATSVLWHFTWIALILLSPQCQVECGCVQTMLSMLRYNTLFRNFKMHSGFVRSFCPSCHCIFIEMLLKNNEGLMEWCLTCGVPDSNPAVEIVFSSCQRKPFMTLTMPPSTQGL